LLNFCKFSLKWFLLEFFILRNVNTTIPSRLFKLQMIRINEIIYFLMYFLCLYWNIIFSKIIFVFFKFSSSIMAGSNNIHIMSQISMHDRLTKRGCVSPFLYHNQTKFQAIITYLVRTFSYIFFKCILNSVSYFFLIF